MADPVPNKAFRDFKLKEAGPTLTEAEASAGGSLEAVEEESGPIEGQAPSSAEAQDSRCEAEINKYRPASPATSFPSADGDNIGFFQKSEYQGLARHRLIVCACFLLAAGIFAMSAIDLKPLLSRDGVIDSSLHITLDPKPPVLNPDLAYWGNNKPSEGLIKVWQHGWNQGKVGLVDLSGKLVVPPQFAELGDFHEGLASAAVKEKDETLQGYIDKSGKFVIPAHYDQTWLFHDGVATAQKGSYYFLINRTGKELFRTEKNPQIGRDYTDETSGAPYDYNKETAPGSQGAIPEDSLLARYGPLFMVNRHNGAAGLLDKSGKWVTPEYDKIVALSKDNLQGYAPQSLNEGLRADNVHPASSFKFLKDGLWGILDTSGKEIIAPKFTSILSYQNGHAAVMVGGKYGFADAQGQIVIQPEYDFVTAFDKIIAVKQGKVWKFIDSQGRSLNIPAIDGVIHSGTGVWLSDGLGPVIKKDPVTKKDNVGFLNSLGEFAIQPQFDWAFAFHNGYAPVWDGSFWHYIDKGGKRVSPNLAKADSFFEGKSAVTIPGPLYSFANFNQIDSWNNGVAGWKNRVLHREKLDEK